METVMMVPFEIQVKQGDETYEFKTHASSRVEALRLAVRELLRDRLSEGFGPTRPLGPPKPYGQGLRGYPVCLELRDMLRKQGVDE